MAAGSYCIASARTAQRTSLPTALLFFGAFLLRHYPATNFIFRKVIYQCLLEMIEERRKEKWEDYGDNEGKKKERRKESY
jgi:hypothetical protein